MWDCDRLAREWDTHRMRVLRTDYDESLAATIELSLVYQHSANSAATAATSSVSSLFFLKG